jgi:hypothetical protein
MEGRNHLRLNPKTIRTPSAAALFLLCSALLPVAAGAQAIPTAGRNLTLTGWGAATGAWTGVAGGHNLGVTAGLDIGFRPIFGLRPEGEIRGTYPVDSGTIVGEKNALGGLKLGADLFALHLYGDFLAGRGEMTYQRGGFPVGNLLYTKSSSTIYSFGGGAEYAVTSHFGILADYQFQRWKTPVTASGSAQPRALSLGITYHLFVDRFPY